MTVLALSTVVASANAGSVSLVEVPNGGISDGSPANLSGTVTTDIRLDSTNDTILSQQIYLTLDSGSVFNHNFGSNTPPNSLLIPAFPALAYDTFLTAGTVDNGGGSAPTPTIVGKSDALGGPGGTPAVLGPDRIDALWGPALGQDTTNKTNYVSARITLSGDANGTFSYRASFGDGPQVLTDIPIQAGHIGFIESAYIYVYGLNGDLIANGDDTPSLLDGTDFGEVYPLPRALQQFSIECTGLCPIVLEDPVVTGPFYLFSFPDQVNDSDSFYIGLRTLAPGRHNGSISFGHDGSNPSPYTFSITAFVVPEPATISLLGLALLGVAGLIRTRVVRASSFARTRTATE